jgi:hypothetical protein
MSFGQYLIGVALSAVALVPILAGARALRRALAPAFTGAAAWVAGAVLAIALVVLALELVGILGLLHRFGAAGGCALIGLAAWRAGPVLAARLPGGPGLPREACVTRREGLVVLVAVGIAAAPWLAWTLFAYAHGMETVDTLWYHLPFAARFTQLGSILHLQYFDADPVTVFYPADSELLHALGLALFHSDFLSPLVNLGWGALALAAGWAIGRPFGRGALSLLGVLVVLATPGLVDSQPGGGYNDVVCIALLLAAAAILVNARAQAGPQPGPAQLGPPSALAAVATGLALGTKFTMIVPAVLLGVGVVVVSARGQRIRQGTVWLGGLVLLGGYWYLRNWVSAGNPIPSVALHLGPLSLPAPHVATATFTVSQYVLNGYVWKTFLIPGLRESLGLAWWALLLGAGAGGLAALLAVPDRIVRMLGAVALISFGAFLVTPQFLGLPGLPVFFVDNVRYVDSALALGLALLPLAPVFRRRRAAEVLLVGLGLAVLATELDPGVWPIGLDLKPFSSPVHGTPAIVGALLGGLLVVIGAVWRVGHRPWARLGAAGGAAAAVLVIVGGGLVAHAYTDRSYRGTDPLPRIYAWAQRGHHLRIGIDGFDLQYPLYGQGATNYVQYVGTGAPHAGFRAVTSCPAWRAAIDHGHYGWLVITPAGFPFGTAASVAPQVRWLSGQPVTPWIRERGAGGAPVVLYRVEGRLDPATC